MKRLLNVLTITILSLCSWLEGNGFVTNRNSEKNIHSETKNNPAISKIANLDLDIISIATINRSVLASSTANPPYSKRGLYRSIDNTNFIKSSIQGEMDSIVSTKRGMVYMANSGVLYASSNGGVSFNRNESFNQLANCIGISVNDIIYVGSKNILYQSKDGITFNQIYNFGNFIIQKIVIAQNNTIYLMIGSENHQYVTKSFDLGYHFMQISTIDSISDVSVDLNSNVYILSFVLYKSIDNGNNFFEVWTSRDLFLLHLFTGVDNSVYITSMDTLYKVDPDNRFNKIWEFTELVRTATSAADGMVWVGTNHGLYKIWFT